MLFFSSALVLALASRFAVGHDILCETSDGSPTIGNIQTVIDNLREEHEGGSGKCFEAQTGEDPLECSKTFKGYSGGKGAAF